MKLVIYAENRINVITRWLSLIHIFPDSNSIKYYAQELKENTYNLTRMNLVMRGILPSNIVVRNGDTLERDLSLIHI